MTTPSPGRTITARGASSTRLWAIARRSGTTRASSNTWSAACATYSGWTNNPIGSHAANGGVHPRRFALAQRVEGGFAMPRIVTMIASATEIVCALGFENELVARSHECDYPASVTRLPVCTAPRFDVHGSSLEIDQRVKSFIEEAASIYRVDADLLRQMQPDVIVTQAHCEVCAVSEKDVEQAMASWLRSPPTPLSDGEGSDWPKIVSLSPNNLGDVWQSIRNVANALGVSDRGEVLVKQLQARVERVS